MTYLHTRAQSHRQSRIGLRHVTIFLSGSALLLATQVAFSAQYPSKVLDQSTAPVVAVRFARSGSIIAASEDGRVSLWGSDTAQPIWSISLARPSRKNDYTQIKISGMDLSADGRSAVVSYTRFGVDRNLIDEKAGDPIKQKDRVWEIHVALIDATDGTIKKNIEMIRDTSVNAIVLASSGKYVFVTTATSLAQAILKHESPISTTQVLSTDTGQVLRSFRSQGWIASASLSPDDRWFVAAAQQYVEGHRSFYELQFYDAETGRLMHRSEFETANTAAISFSLDGGLLALSRSAKHGLQVDLVSKDGSEKLTHLITAAKDTESRAVAVIREQNELVLAGGRLHFAGVDDIGTARFRDQGGVVLVIDQKTCAVLRTYQLASFVTCLSVSHDGLKVVAGMYDGRVAIISIL
jgi:WD40 repeat protein